MKIQYVKDVEDLYTFKLYFLNIDAYSVHILHSGNLQNWCFGSTQVLI